MLDDETPVDEDLFKSLITDLECPSIVRFPQPIQRPIPLNIWISPTGRGVTGYALDDETPDDVDLFKSLGMLERPRERRALSSHRGSRLVPFVLGIRKIVLILFI